LNPESFSTGKNRLAGIWHSVVAFIPVDYSGLASENWIGGKINCVLKTDKYSHLY